MHDTSATFLHLDRFSLSGPDRDHTRNDTVSLPAPAPVHASSFRHNLEPPLIILTPMSTVPEEGGNLHLEDLQQIAQLQSDVCSRLGRSPMVS